MQSCIDKSIFLCFKFKFKTLEYNYNNPIAMSCLNDYIDFCDGSEFDVARLGSMILSKKDYMYVGKNKWQYSNDNGDTWFPDKDQKRLIHAFKTRVFSMFIERSVYWNEESRSDYEYISIRLSKMFLKINNNAFIKNVIKESQAFFLTEDL